MNNAYQGTWSSQPYWQYTPPYPTWSPQNVQTNARTFSSQQFQPVNNLIKVAGRPGADAYFLPPNSSVILLDANEPIFYWKVTDDGGFATVREFSFAEITPAKQPASMIEAHAVDTSDMVSRAEFEEFKKMMIGGGDA